VKIRVKEHIAPHRPWDVFRFVSHLPDFARLFFRLLGERRVAAMAKLLLLAGAAYAVSPLDFLPDVMPLLGQVDDLTIFAMVCRMFIQLCPRNVVEEHISQIDRTGAWAPFGQRVQVEAPVRNH
jgi:uncharacterized membrane protein YkvA (DUF1232 family)